MSAEHVETARRPHQTAESEYLDSVGPRRDHHLVGMIRAAQAGDGSAWEQLITRFQPLVGAVTWRFRLSAADAADVSQTVWLRLIEHVDRLRDPEAIAGWILTTTARSCLQAIALARRNVLVDPLERGLEAHGSARSAWDENRDQPGLDEALLRAEIRRAVREGLGELEPHEQELLMMICAEPRPSYRQISDRLGLPIGSIGPNRARYLGKLSRTPSVRQLLPAESDLDSAA